ADGGRDARRAHRPRAGVHAPAARRTARAHRAVGLRGGGVSGGNGGGAPPGIPPRGPRRNGPHPLPPPDRGTTLPVDCGVMSPDEQMLGIDVVIPDVSYLRGLGDRFRAIFLTHAHEDHIGALPYVLAERAVPVHGTPLTLGFVRERLREHGLSATLVTYGSEPCT